MQRGSAVVFLSMVALCSAPRDALAQGRRGSREKTEKGDKAKADDAKAQAGATPDKSDAEISKVEKLYAELEYEQAAALGHALIDKGGLSHEELVRVLRLVALSHAGHDQEEGAREAFVSLLGYEPDYQVDPNLGPRVTTPFFSARGFWRGQAQRPGLDLTADVKSSTGGVIRLNLRDPLHVAKSGTVSFRWAGAGDFEAKPLDSLDTSSVEVSAAPPGASRLEYFAVVLDAKRNEVFEAGSARAPKTQIFERSAAHADEKPAFYKNPIVIGTAAAVVVVAAVTVGYFLLRDRTPTSASLSPTPFCANGAAPAPCN